MHQPIRFRHGLGILGVVLVAASPPCQAGLLQSPPDHVQFVSRNWRSSEGLPQNSGNAIVQTRDGHVWIGTTGGLCRSDGDRLQVFDAVPGHGLRSIRITCLHEAVDGTLWIGTDRGGLSRYRDGVFASVSDHATATIQALAEDASHRLLVATSAGMLRVDADRLVPVHPELRPVRQLVRRRSGDMLAVGADGVWQFRDDSAGEGQATLVLAAAATCVAEFGDHLLVGSLHGLGVAVEGSFRAFQPLAELAQPVLSLLATRDGALWVGTNQRPVRLEHPDVAQAATTATGGAALPSLTVPQAARALCEDRDGGVWIGHTEAGVTRLQRAEVYAHAEAAGLPPRGLTTVNVDHDGSLLVGTAGGLLRRRNGRFEPIPGCESFGACMATLVEPDGTLWLATGAGLVRRKWGEAAEPCPMPEPMSGKGIRALARAEDGLWIGGDGGLAVLQEHGTRPVPVPFAAEFADAAVRSLRAAPDGAMWIGAATGLWRLSPDRRSLTAWHSGVELPWGEVRAILPEAGVHAWIGTYGGGLVRIDDDRRVRIDRSVGLAEQSICALIAWPEYLLLITNHGLSMVRHRDLDAVVAGTSRSLACRHLRAEGRRVAECSGGLQACANVIDGHVWWCGIQALYEFAPEAIDLSPANPPVHLRDLFLGEHRWPGGDEVLLPTGLRSIVVQLGTCSFDGYHDVRYRWRLLGADGNWSEPSYDPEVRLPSLPPGDLTFEAEAIGFDGTRSPTPLRLSLHLPRRLLEHGWAQAGAVLAGAALLLLVVRFASRRSAWRALQLQQLVDERTRELQVIQRDPECRVQERTHDLQLASQRQQDEMSERQRLERQLQQLQRMESIGLLAGGIANDFNNILTVALGAAAVLEPELGTAEGREICANLRLACERGRGLTQHLLAVASRQLVRAEHLDLDALVRRLLPVLRRLLGEDVVLGYQGPGQPASVMAATTQLEQILLNLAGNARDALPRGGKVTIAVGVAAGGVVLSLVDDGVGMAPDVLERVFEPFFSTKGRSGRGLGLATVYGITKQLGGTATITSAPGRGTTVTIALPAAAGDAAHGPAAAPAAAAKAASTPPEATAGTTLLLIEDEAEVRRALTRLLQHLGCRVIAAADGAEAVAALRTHLDTIDAVLSDVVLPGLRGAELVVALRQLRADLPILFATGYLDGRLIHRDLTAMGLDILEKPIEPDRLAQALQRLLPSRRFPVKA
ncbi:MAG: response regulator [Planctomycetes bacterium]|nr:response regulator [Planctomycetota bacterium]